VTNGRFGAAPSWIEREITRARGVGARRSIKTINTIKTIARRRQTPWQNARARADQHVVVTYYDDDPLVSDWDKLPIALRKAKMVSLSSLVKHRFSFNGFSLTRTEVGAGAGAELIYDRKKIKNFMGTDERAGAR
jgi:hypothetical protein